MKNFSVASQSGMYRVRFVTDIGGQLKKSLPPAGTHAIIDRTVWNLYEKELRITGSWKSRQIITVRETEKTLETVTDVITRLLKSGIDRTETIVVIGGGQLQDIGSFSAHALCRGVRWIFVPTTLLSQADSCIGSKSALNAGRYKNQIGAFHPPSEIYIYPPFVKSLPPGAIADGIGEILKHALIAGGKTYTSLTALAPSVPGDMKKTGRAIFESLMVKKAIIEIDEFDRNRRRLLNYGHTFGHALEGYSKNRISHGTGVTIGMDLANFISWKRGLLKKSEFDHISAMLHGFITVKKWPVSDISAYMDFVAHDKKVTGNSVRAILCRGVGNIVPLPLPLDRRLARDVKEYGKYFGERL